MNPAWRRTLEALLESDGMALSAIPKGLRKDLEAWGERTGTLRLVVQGRGARLQVVNAAMLRDFVRMEFPVEPSGDLPERAWNLAYARNTKSGKTTLDIQYVLGKRIGTSPDVNFQGVDLSLLTARLGCFALPLSPHIPGLEVDLPLLLVENQAVFDHVNWLPDGWNGVLLYYSGNLCDALLGWLMRCRFRTIELFADYDGTGLRNFARLREVVPECCWHWEMDWEDALERYGNRELWRKETQKADIDALWDTWETAGWPDRRLRVLMEAMRRKGMMLEQEWVLAR